MRRLVSIALVAPAFALGGLVAAPAAQAACEPGPLRTELGKADLVVTGKVTAVEKKPRRTYYTVAVRRVYAGSATATLELQAPIKGWPCYLPVKKGQEWLFVSSGDDKPPVLYKRGGSTPLTAATATVVADVLGSGKRPTADATPPEVSMQKLDAKKPWGFWQVALPGAVLAGGGFLVLLLARALGRARR